MSLPLIFKGAPAGPFVGNTSYPILFIGNTLDPITPLAKCVDSNLNL